VPVESKKGVLTSIFPLLRDHSIGNVPSLLLAAALGGVFAFLVGLPLMRLSGLAAGIATFAVLEITHNVLREWTKIGPGATLRALTTEQVYLELTFLTLAMLVVGGLTSVWGAVVGALAVSGLDSFLSRAESGVHVVFTFTLPQGTRLVFLAAIMALVLILRPSGLTGGRELRLRWSLRRWR